MASFRAGSRNGGLEFTARKRFFLKKEAKTSF
jgi:hypothetical protein